MSCDTSPLAMTMGDPAGIGPELALAAWRDRSPGGAPFLVFAAPGLLAATAKRAGPTAPIIEPAPPGARSWSSRDAAARGRKPCGRYGRRGLHCAHAAQ